MSEWVEDKLVNLADVKVSNVDKKSHPGQREVRLCNYMDVYSNDYITADIEFMDATASLAEIEKFSVARGDVLITKDSETPEDIGVPAVVMDDIPGLVCGYHLAQLKPRDKKIEPVLLAKLLSTHKSKLHFAKSAAGSTRFGLSIGSIEKMPICYPEDPDLQKKIADILETVDEAIEQTEALIAKYEQIRAGMMQDLFTRGLTPDGKLRPPREEAPHLYQETPIGWTPKDWDVEPLSSHSDIVSGVTLNAANSPKSGTVPVPYLRVANVQDGYLDLTEIKMVEVTPVAVERYRLEFGDVLMNEGGDFDKLGRGTVWRGEIEECIHQNHVFRVRPNSKRLRSDFLSLWSQSIFGKRYFLLSSKQSTNLASINSNQLKAFPVGLPSPFEQEEIEKRLSAVGHQISFESQHLNKLRQQKAGLMADLLTGKVPVKV